MDQVIVMWSENNNSDTIAHDGTSNVSLMFSPIEIHINSIDFLKNLRQQKNKTVYLIIRSFLYLEYVVICIIKEVRIFCNILNQDLKS